MLLMLDNYDSFTYNLVQYLGELGARVKVVRNDRISVNDAVALKPAQLVVSPGPCTPDEAGISVELIQALAGVVPILGVCLGHQSIGQAFGARIVTAENVLPGKAALAHHGGVGVFSGLPDPYRATRYRSLGVEQESLPGCFEATAWSWRPDGSREEIMGLRHKELDIEGVQFHPESILTEQGHALLQNFLNK